MNSIFNGICGRKIYRKCKIRNNLNLILPDLDYELNNYAIMNIKNIIKENNFENACIFTNKENDEDLKSILSIQNLEYKIIFLNKKELDKLIQFYLLKSNSGGKCIVNDLRLISLSKNYIEFNELYQKNKLKKDNIVNIMLNRYEF